MKDTNTLHTQRYSMGLILELHYGYVPGQLIDKMDAHCGTPVRIRQHKVTEHLPVVEFICPSSKAFLSDRVYSYYSGGHVSSIMGSILGRILQL